MSYINNAIELNAAATQENSGYRTSIKHNKKLLDEYLDWVRDPVSSEELEPTVTSPEMAYCIKLKIASKYYKNIQIINKRFSLMSQFYREVKKDDPSLDKLIKLRDDIREAACATLEVAEHTQASGNYVEVCDKMKNANHNVEQMLMCVLYFKKNLCRHQVVEFMNKHK